MRVQYWWWLSSVLALADWITGLSDLNMRFIILVGRWSGFFSIKQALTLIRYTFLVHDEACRFRNMLFTFEELGSIR